jgi:hypothetical protein
MTKYQLINEIIVNKIGYDKNIKNNIMDFLLPSKDETMDKKDYVMMELKAFVEEFNNEVSHYLENDGEWNEDGNWETYNEIHKKIYLPRVMNDDVWWSIFSFTNSMWSFHIYPNKKQIIWCNNNTLEPYYAKFPSYEQYKKEFSRFKKEVSKVSKYL